MSITSPRRSTRTIPLVAALCVSVLVGCASVPRTGQPQPGEIRRDPGAYVAELERLSEAGRFEAVDSLARAIIAADPDGARTDEVLFMAARAGYATEHRDRAIAYSEELSTRYPLSPRRGDALLIAADAYREDGRNYESAEMLSRLLESPLDPALEEKAREKLLRLAGDELSPADLERLVRAHPTSPVAEDVSLKVAKAEFARGNYERAYVLLAELLHQYPQHARAREIRYLLEASAGRKTDPSRTPAFVELNSIGVLLPYTGEYSRFGRSFEEGVRLALDEFNASAETPAKYILGDTKSDPISALIAARKLIVESGVVAVVGSVFTIPSIVAAAECNAWKVPMVSPLVREPTFGEIGPWVFQMQLPVEVEAAGMAKLAVGELLLERIAVLAPSTPEGRRLSEFFVGQVERLGGDVVAKGYYGVGDTDFREQIGAIRAGAPDAIFIPGGADELVNILPQIRFYDVQIQLLGLSNWNSEKLLRLAARELEGAVFPREGYYGKDPEAYGRFAARYMETHAKDGGESDDVSPVTAAAYFGTRFVLSAIHEGAVDREQIRDYLRAELDSSADARLNEVSSLPLLKVVSGKPREFTPPKTD